MPAPPKSLRPLENTVAALRRRPALKRLAGLPRTKTVLVVSTGLGMREVLTSAVRDQLRLRVINARGVVEAQSVAANEKEIHLLLIYASVPESADLQLALWFRAMYPGTKVLLASDSLWEINFQLGVSQELALLAKPFTASRLAEMMHAILD